MIGRVARSWGLTLILTTLVHAQEPQVVISEVQAGGLQFVELHNPGAQPIDLKGYRLTGDALHIFTKPTPIKPGAHVLLLLNPMSFQRKYPQARRHNILDDMLNRISSRGGELRLHDPRGQLVDRVEYGATGSGRSLQRISATTSYRGPLNWTRAKPTPGVPNQVAGTLPALAIDQVRQEPERPTSKTGITVSARLHRAEKLEQVTLVWRLRDGAQRSETMTRVEGTATWRGTIPPQPDQTLVRYRVVARGGGVRRELDRVPWGERLETFVFDGKTRTQLPLYWLELDAPAAKALQSKPERREFAGSFVFLEQGRPRIRRVRIRVRGGFWTQIWLKKSWSVIFQRPFRGQRRITLRGNWMDPTCMREVLALDLFRQAGVPAPRSELVRVHLNGAFWGLYTEVEEVDARFLSRNGLHDAVLYRPEEPLDVKAAIANDSWSDGRAFPTLLGYETHWTKKTFVREPFTDLQRFIEGYTQAGVDDLEAYFERHVEVERVIRYLAVCALLTHWDSLAKNFYWCFDRAGSGKWSVIPWDLDLTWGRWLVSRAQTYYRAPVFFGTKEHPDDRGTYVIWSRFRDRFLSVPAYRDRLDRTILRFIRTLFVPKTLIPEIERRVRALYPEIVIDRKKWGEIRTMGDTPQPFDPRHLNRDTELLLKYVEARAMFLRRQCSIRVSEVEARKAAGQPVPTPSEVRRARTTADSLILAVLTLGILVYAAKGMARDPRL